MGRLAAVLATIAVVAIIVVIALINRTSIAPGQPPIYAPLKVGDLAPHFATTTIDGRRIDSAQLAGPIMLELFATWCPHCQHETATINELQRRFGDRLAIIAVSASDVAADRQSAETLEDVKAFAQYFGVKYPIAYDVDLGVAKSYLQGGFPTIVFINASKHVTAVRSGETALHQLIVDARAAGAKEVSHVSS